MVNPLVVVAYWIWFGLRLKEEKYEAENSRESSTLGNNTYWGIIFVLI